MVPALYPPTPPFPPDDGGAEAWVHQAPADQLPDDAALFHGFHVQDEYCEHEVDLLIAWPDRGLAAHPFGG